MSKRPRVPSYRHHKPSGQAVVTLGGRDFYLGLYNSPESHKEYNRLIAEWLAGGKTEPIPPGIVDLTVNEVCERYLAHAEGYYPKEDEGQTSAGQISRVRRAIGAVTDLYGGHPVKEFGPRALKAVREGLIARGCAREYINCLINCVKRAWKWAVAEELVDVACYEKLRAVEGLKKGRSEAPESPDVPPVPQDVLDATLPCLNPVMRQIADLQLLTGMRPGEATSLRMDELDMSADVWTYKPQKHKTAWRGTERIVLLGPRAQEIVSPLLAHAAPYCFRPYCRPTNGKTRPYYLVTSYSQGVLKACDRAERRRREEADLPLDLDQGERVVTRWHPHQLRHNAATAIVKEFGWDVARIILGHATLDATRLYGLDDIAKAREAVRKVG